MQAENLTRMTPGLEDIFLQATEDALLAFPGRRMENEPNLRSGKALFLAPAMLAADVQIKSMEWWLDLNA